MAMGRRKRQQQQPLWLDATEAPKGPGHPFYRRLNEILDAAGFDAFAEEACSTFYARKMGRPSLAPGVYFRLLLVGYFEGLDSERGIAWRAADSLTLRGFLGLELTAKTPDHSTISRTRRRIDVVAHHRVFSWVLARLAESGLLRGQTLGIDGTTLEANAALRSIVRRDSGEGYTEFLEGLAKASGIETPTREQLAKLDKKRPKKGSNKDWSHPEDPEARITKMKDGRTHLAHKAEHAVDMETGAIVAVTLQGADQGDTRSLEETEAAIKQSLEAVLEDPEAAQHLDEELFSELVADKGYHSNDVMTDHKELGIRTYISEPDRGRRRWKDNPQAQAATYANRRRIRGARGRRLMRQRGELVERSFAHCYETGGMRRTHLRGHANILKRLLIHIAGFNLGLLMRQRYAVGKPRGLQGLRAALLALISALWRHLRRLSALRTSLAAPRHLGSRFRAAVASAT